jgi:endoglucanase
MSLTTNHSAIILEANMFKKLLSGLALLLIIIGLGFSATNLSLADATEVWWPANGATVSGIQPFKAMYSGRAVENYKMFWQVDNGGLVEMPNNYTDYPHKEASVDLSGWNWKGAGPYTITFTAKDFSGNELSRNSVTIYTSTTSTPAPITTTTNTVTQTTQTTIKTVSSGTTLFVNPDSPAAQKVREWSGWTEGATLMSKIATGAESKWFGNWNSNIYNDINSYVQKATDANATAVLVAYNIPQRDCGGYSSGGSSSESAYKNWINSFAGGIGDKKAIVVLEPDALAQMDCLSSSDQNRRTALLSYAVSTLKSKPNVQVYLDAGHPYWKSPNEIANRLKSANISKADGFSLNVSNFITTDENKTYGKKVSDLVGGKHFVIDTSRNGSGSNSEWCNPWGRSLGAKPTTSTGDSTVDAYLWIKVPGESDGTCNGGPSAGVFWADYALDLARNTR